MTNHIKTNILSIGLILLSIFVILLSLRQTDYIKWIGLISGFMIIGVEIAHILERIK